MQVFWVNKTHGAAAPTWTTYCLTLQVRTWQLSKKLIIIIFIISMTIVTQSLWVRNSLNIHFNKLACTPNCEELLKPTANIYSCTHSKHKLCVHMYTYPHTHSNILSKIRNTVLLYNLYKINSSASQYFVNRLVCWAGLHLYTVWVNCFIVHTLLIRRWRTALLVPPPGAEEGDDTSSHIGEQGQC